MQTTKQQAQLKSANEEKIMNGPEMGFGSSFEDVMNGGEQIGLRKNRQQQSTNAAAGAVFLQLYNFTRKPVNL